MSTFGGMVAQIGDEMEDDELPIAAAIRSAVKAYRGKRFWFNTVYNSSFAVASGDEYTAPELTVTGLSATEPITTIDLLKIDDGTGANYRTIDPVSNSYVDASQTGASSSRPRYYTLVSDDEGTKIRWFPKADQAYTAIVSGLIRFEDLTEDTQFNPWINDAEELIRQAAKRILMSDTTKELPPGSGPTPAEMLALNALQKETRLRMGSTPMRADEITSLQRGGTRRGFDITTGGF